MCVSFGRGKEGAHSNGSLGGKEESAMPYPHCYCPEVPFRGKYLVVDVDSS